MSAPEQATLETDPRFPSGPWTGFFLQSAIPGKHRMELHLVFDKGVLTGEGRDWVGTFILRGQYNLSDGKCCWIKRYVGKHDVAYQGFNEGKGIWGVWEMSPENHPTCHRGGFHIWPEGMPDPSRPQLTEEADLPIHVEEIYEERSDPVLTRSSSERLLSLAGASG